MSLYVICSLIICLVSIFLTVHPRYEDGVVGKISLLCISVSCAVVVGERFDGVVYEVHPTTLGVQVGLSIFLLRHVYRFSKWVKHGSFDWRKNEKATPVTDVVCPLLRPTGNSKPRRKRDASSLKARS